MPDPLALKDGTQAPFSLSQAGQYDHESAALARILTHCPPRNYCRTCEGRLNHRFGGSADKTAKYRHQAEQAGMAARRAVKSFDEPVAYELARRAGTYAAMVLA